MDENLQDRVVRIETVVGLTKDGRQSGNGLLLDTSTVEKDTENIYSQIEQINFSIKAIGQKLDIMEKDMQNIKQEIRYNLNVHVIKNVVVGIGSVLGAIAIIGYVVQKIYAIFTK